jgi:sugar fermentation stimulation protein A
MNWSDGPLVTGIFMERLHRFGAWVRIRGRKEYCHVTNSGRLKELLYPGAQVALVDHLPKLKIHHSKPLDVTRGRELVERLKIPRKTRFAVRLAFYRGKWVCIEANIAPKLLMEAWKEGRVPQLARYDKLRAEVPLSRHTRFDFQAENSRTGNKAWIEVKCSTLVDHQGIGRFPDAPSERATKHLHELMAQAKRPKTKCFVFFIAQNPHGKAVAPKDDTDPVFGKTLRKASGSGVILGAFHARVSKRGARLNRRVPVLL